MIYYIFYYIKNPYKKIISILPVTYIRKKDRHFTLESLRVVSSWYITPQKNTDNRHCVSNTDLTINNIFDIAQIV